MIDQNGIDDCAPNQHPLPKGKPEPRPAPVIARDKKGKPIEIPYVKPRYWNQTKHDFQDEPPMKGLRIASDENGNPYNSWAVKPGSEPARWKPEDEGDPLLAAYITSQDL